MTEGHNLTEELMNERVLIAFSVQRNITNVMEFK